MIPSLTFSRLALYGFFLLDSIAAQHLVPVPGRYLVELNAAPAKSTSQRAAMVLERNELKSAVEKLRGTFVPVAGTVLNAAVIEVPEESSSRLSKLPGVKRIEPVLQGTWALNAALDRSRVPQAWALGPQGAAGAGRGIRIAILDSGIDATHPAFQSNDPMPDGYPRVRHDRDLALTNGKLVVIRNYQDRLRFANPSAVDTDGHGTATAGAAAAAPHLSLAGEIRGAAPAAQLGIYKVGPTLTGAAWQSDTVIQAIDDAVADGMHVISISLGFSTGTPIGRTLIAEAIEAAERAGVIVVGAAGNNGPNPATIGAVSVTDAMITAGAIPNDRLLTTYLRLDGLDPIPMIPGAGTERPSNLTAPLADAGFACEPLPPQSLMNRIALIERGICNFETKLTNAGRAGARAAIVTSDRDRPTPTTMPVTGTSFPAAMVSFADGQLLRNRLSANATLDFVYVPATRDVTSVAAFSSRGPGPLLALEPDLSAVGGDILVPVQRTARNGRLFDASGHLILDGTSFSTPIIAGAAAVLRQQRPGLTPAQYRSLLINAARPLGNARPQDIGAGVLDLEAAAKSTLAAQPTSLLFGAVENATLRLDRPLTLTNVSNTAETYTLAAQALEGNTAPEPSRQALTLGPGESARLSLRWFATNMAPGAHQGVIEIRGESSGTLLRVPYWAAVPENKPAFVTPLTWLSTAPAGSLVEFYVNVTDRAGLAVAEQRPFAIPVTGINLSTGSTVSVMPAGGPEGAFVVRIQLSDLPGVNQFRLEAGGARSIVNFLGTP